MVPISKDYLEHISFANTDWVEDRALVFHRCLFSDKWIFPGQKVIHGIRTIRSGYGHVREHFWTTIEEYWLQKLRGTYI